MPIDEIIEGLEAELTAQHVKIAELESDKDNLLVRALAAEDENRRLEAEVLARPMSEELRHGLPVAPNSGDVPQDGKPYRVFFRSQIVRWDIDSGAWFFGDHEFGQYYVRNCDWWAPVEPKETGN